MYAAYTDWLASNANAIDWGSVSAIVAPITRSSGMASTGDVLIGGGTNDTIVSGVISAIDLAVKDGWQVSSMVGPDSVLLNLKSETISDPDNTLDGYTLVSVAPVDGSIPKWTFSVDPAYVEAFAIIIKGTILGEKDPVLGVFRMGEGTLFGGSSTHPARISQGSEYENEFLFAYKDGEPGLELCPIDVSIPILGWESAHVLHTWLYPERVNFVANPSFEAGMCPDSLPFGWRTNSTLEEVGTSESPMGVGPYPRRKCGYLTGPEPVKILESNFFPAVTNSTFWSIEASVSGVGTYRIGVTFWAPGMDPANCQFFSKEHTVSASNGSFEVIKAVLDAPDDAWAAQFRIEYEGEEFYIDNVLAEPSEAGLPYFDGSWDIGQPGDANWYGIDLFTPEQVTHRSFSTYYPNRNKFRKYLFGYSDAAGEHVGAAYSHVPERNKIVPHWDDVYYSRVHSWTRDVRIPVVDFPAQVKNTVVVLP